MTHLGAARLEALLGQLDPRGKDFERLVAWFLRNDPEYAARIARVWLWEDWPGRWGIDKGIDLIAEERDGHVIAVQAKQYDPRYSITKTDVDRFLSESNRREISERLLVATTEQVARNGREVMCGQEKPVELCLRSRLLESHAPWPSTLSAMQPCRPPRLEPRPHQAEALDAISSGLARTDRGQVIMACGTGKSLVALWAAERLQADLTLVMVPTLALIRQTAQQWAAESTAPPAALKICSDKTREHEPEGFDFDALDVGGGVTTEPGAIAAFLRRVDRRVVFCTYHSSRALADAMALVRDARFDLAICDEAHWCAGLQGGTNKLILDDEAIPAARRLFMTATPVLYNDRDVNTLRKQRIQIASMRDVRLFGRELHRLSMADAIDRDILCPYQVVVMPVSDEEVQTLIHRRTLVTVDAGDSRNDAYSVATQIACARAMKTFGCRRMVAYHPRIERSRAFSEQFDAAARLLPADRRPDGTVVAGHIDGDRMSKATRLKVLQDFSTVDDRHYLLSNVKILSEGVDVPGIDAITLVDTERNAQQVVQIIGRAVRKAAGKTVGTIVLPVLVRGDESVTAAIERSEHRPIVRLLAALRAADPDLERSVDELRVQVGPDGWPVSSRRRFVIDAPREIGQEFADAVEVMLVDHLASARPGRRLRSVPADSRDDDARVIEFKQPDWTDPAAIQEGLRVLEAAVGRGLVDSREFPYLFVRFPLAKWWGHLLRTWTATSPSWDTKRRVAQLITWTSVSKDDHPRARKDLMQLSRAPLPDHVHAFLAHRLSYWYGDFVHQDIIGPWNAHNQKRGVLHTARILAALTHPSMPYERQAERLLEALLVAAKGAQNRRERRSFADGFTHALEEHPQGCPIEDAPADKESDSLTGNYVAGWLAAAPLLPLVDEVRDLRVRLGAAVPGMSAAA